jgi:predicted dehydrogenase
MRIIATLFALLVAGSVSAANSTGPAPVSPIRLAVVGLVHDHARILFPMLKGRSDFQLVAVVESDPVLIERYERQYGLDPSLFVSNLEELFSRQPVDAVATFTTTLGHRAVVEACAAHHVDVMMEKPFAVNLGEARAMAKAAEAAGISLVVNFETSWYASNAAAYQVAVRDGSLGKIRKILVQDGHSGPKTIGVSPEFLGWLSDPQQGGGATLDFGCYGADLITWIMGGRRPVAVTAVAQNLQPTVYSKVEDESTIILEYPEAQGIIQASWNWPVGRKDMEIYGERGALVVPDGQHLHFATLTSKEGEMEIPPLKGAEEDQLSYLAAVVRHQIVPSGLSSVETNLVVTEILDAARESASTGRRVVLSPTQ